MTQTIFLDFPIFYKVIYNLYIKSHKICIFLLFFTSEVQIVFYQVFVSSGHGGCSCGPESPFNTRRVPGDDSRLHKIPQAKCSFDETQNLSKSWRLGHCLFFIQCSYDLILFYTILCDFYMIYIVFIRLYMVLYVFCGFHLSLYGFYVISYSFSHDCF